MTNALEGITETISCRAQSVISLQISLFATNPYLLLEPLTFIYRSAWMEKHISFHPGRCAFCINFSSLSYQTWYKSAEEIFLYLIPPKKDQCGAICYIEELFYFLMP